MTSTVARAFQGPAGGRRFDVALTAGYAPRFIGLDGGNYVLDVTSTPERPVYLWWPKGAPEPVKRVQA